jgi:hypothetical protein
MKYVEKKCRKLAMGEVDFSPKLGKARQWKLLCQRSFHQPGQLSCAPKIHKTKRHSAMTTAAVLQLLQPLQMNNNDHRH